ncbi:DUF1330 domain-containing protein [Olleya sp. AH-315-F22]|nr:DUF1330 domain-containing protein [Olleya sp. AH-315-F22]
MLTHQVSTTEAQLAELKAYPQNTPLVMLNILKFKEQTSTNETGQEVYERYLKNTMPFVEKSGVKIIWKGQVHNTVIGDSKQQPHVVFLVEYPSVNHFFSLVSNPDYQKIAGDRAIALEYGGLIACQNAE